MGLRVLISGASGFLGKALVQTFQENGDQVFKLVRKRAQSTHEILWNPYQPIEDAKPYENFDAVIHLSGENIAAGRWTEKQKQKILESRTLSTQNLSEVFQRVQKKPKVFVSASAIGIYPDSGDQILNEESALGNHGFLTEVCRRWEAAVHLPGTRCVFARTGLILHPEGGALKKMLVPFKLGLGAPLGSGRQWISWVSLQDICRMYLCAVQNESLSGPVNFVGPAPVTNRKFSKLLAEALNRPLLPAIPAFILKMTLGEMAEELLLESRRVDAFKLQKENFHFLNENLEELFKAYFGQPRLGATKD